MPVNTLGWIQSSTFRLRSAGKLKLELLPIVVVAEKASFASNLIFS